MGDTHESLGRYHPNAYLDHRSPIPRPWVWIQSCEIAKVRRGVTRIGRVRVTVRRIEGRAGRVRTPSKLSRPEAAGSYFEPFAQGFGHYFAL